MSSRIVNATGPVQAQNDFRSGAIQEVRRLYIAFMQGLFAECPPGNYRWTNDDLSEIAITDETPLNTSTVGKRPAVTHLLTFQNAPKMMSRLCVEAQTVSVNNPLVFYWVEGALHNFFSF